MIDIKSSFRAKNNDLNSFIENQKFSWFSLKAQLNKIHLFLNYENEDSLIMLTDFKINFLNENELRVEVNVNDDIEIDMY